MSASSISDTARPYPCYVRGGRLMRCWLNQGHSGEHDFAAVELCDECRGTRWPLDGHEPHCSLWKGRASGGATSPVASPETERTAEDDGNVPGRENYLALCERHGITPLTDEEIWAGYLPVAVEP